MSDVLFVYMSDVFFGVTEICICKCSVDIQTYFCFCVDVLYVMAKRHSSVKGHSKCADMVGVWDRLPVQHDGRL